VELRLPCTDRTLRILAPAGEDHATADWTRGHTYAYRGSGRGLVMPAVVLYRPDDDWGLTAFANFALPNRGFELTLEHDPPTIVVRRVHLRLEPGKPVTVSMLLAGHEGCWRPGLGHLVRRYPEWFQVADKRVPRLHGAFVCSGGAPDDATIDQWAEQHVQTVEVHGTLPFYGHHLPLAKEWTIFADDQWHQLKELPDPDKPADDATWKALHAYVTRKRPPNISVPKINDYIKRLHARGIYAVMYFNPTEAWKAWIKETYPEARVQRPDGSFFPVWYESHLVCPDPDSAWGKRLVADFEKMMDLYPEADGFFMDQSTYDLLDYAHDDGWSIDGSRTAYRMGWAIGQLSMRLRKLAKARGKFLWWNGPYYIDIAYFAEGMMAEAGHEGDVRRISYLTMGGRASCTLSRKDESTFHNCAAYGIYPTAMPTPELRRLAARYWGVFEHFRGKRWVFHPRALTLPEGTKGNLYRLPDGNALVTMVTDGRAVDGAAFDLDLPLAVRLPDAADFRTAYLVSPDLLGTRRLELERDGDSMSLVLPRHRSVSAVLLARTGVHLSLDGPLGVVAGSRARLAAVVDNWGERPVSGTWTLPGAKGEALRADAGKSVRRALTIEAPAKRSGLREGFVCRATLGRKRLGGDAEFYVDEPLGLDLELPEALHQGEPATVRVRAFNAAAARPVAATLTGEGLRVEPATQQAAVDAGRRHAFEFRITPAQAGLRTVGARVEAGDDQAKAATRIEVYATKASPKAFGRIRTARLAFDVFGSDHGKYENKPVSLNGVRLGILPRGGDRWGHAEMILPREATGAIREHNELRIDNEPADAFKVRNFQLKLCMRNGVYLVSGVNRGVYTGSTGWAYGEGTCVEGGKPLTGIRVDIAVDRESTEAYEDTIGEVVSGEVAFELFGADGGAFAHKPVTFNGIALGDLPTGGGDGWVERAIALPQAALDALGYVNELVIHNSRPRDAFKIRRLHVRLKVKGGATVRSEVDPGVYTSVAWQHAEGTIGCPMEITLRFKRGTGGDR